MYPSRIHWLTLWVGLLLLVGCSNNSVSPPTKPKIPPLTPGGEFLPTEPVIKGEPGKPLPVVTQAASLGVLALDAGDVPVFSESLEDTYTRWENLSWNTQLDTVASPVQVGAAALRLRMSGWGALYLQAKAAISGATGLSFWVYGEATLKVQCLANNQDVGGKLVQAALGWQKIIVSIADCGNPAQINQLLVQNYSPAQREVYLDDFSVMVGTPTDTDTGLSGSKVEAKALVITGERSDVGFKAWTTLLDNLGASYEVLVATEGELTKGILVDADGVGRFNAILLANNSLAVSQNGQLVLPFSSDEWKLLWAYERGFKVRQVVLYGFPNDYPEESCARSVTARALGETPENFSLTPEGAKLFPYLKPSAPIPVRYSYIYPAKLQASCTNAQVLLQDSQGNAMAFSDTSPDGRERVFLTFGSGPVFLHFQLLGYGLLRWATKGLFLGERKYYLNIDLDDWFAATDWRLVGGTFVPGGFRMSAKDGLSTWQLVQNFRTQWDALLDQRSFLTNFNVNIAYNAAGAKLDTTIASCDPNLNGVSDRLTAMSRCLAPRLRWINHTYSHKLVDFSNYDESKAEITPNITVGQQLGFANYPEVLKTGELAGLGYYATVPDGPKTDYGLEASNKDLLKAAKDSGIKYMHGNTSVKSQVPSCNNCLIRHPLEPAISIIPVRPTNIYYFVTTPDEAASAYNAVYGPSGSAPFWPKDLNYSEVLDKESDVALYYLLNGAVNSFYFHQGNLREFETGKNLMFDWANALMTKYATYYTMPLRSLPWSGPGSIAEYVENRTAHFASRDGVRLVYDRSSNTATLTADTNAKVFLTGAQVGTWESYGGDNVSNIQLSAGQSITFDPR